MNTLLIALKKDVLTEGELAQVRKLAPGLDVVVTRDRAEIERLLPHIEIAFGIFPTDLVARAPKLKWFQQWSAGADWLLKDPEAAAKEFVLTSTSGVHAIPITEHVLAFMLAFARGFPAAFRNQAASLWPQRDPAVFELAGKTLLLVGVGHIGERIALLPDALGMHVLGVRRHQGQPAAGVARMGSLEGLLPEADFVVLTVPLTDETSHMIGAAELAAMKDSAYLINIGRGGTVDEDALVSALQAGSIAGAGLDVFEVEPLPADSPLWTMDNVLITSHYSGATPEYARRSFAIFIDNLARYERGEELRNVVDKQAGY
jgi:phosphoglycerate dehydrogenase-like enzyme